MLTLWIVLSVIGYLTWGILNAAVSKCFRFPKDFEVMDDTDAALYILLWPFIYILIMVVKTFDWMDDNHIEAGNFLKRICVYLIKLSNYLADQCIKRKNNV